MALARVVSFDGVTQARVEEMKEQMAEGRPDDIPATEIVMLYPGSSIAPFSSSAMLAVDEPIPPCCLPTWQSLLSFGLSTPSALRVGYERRSLSSTSIPSRASKRSEGSEPACAAPARATSPPRPCALPPIQTWR